MAEPGSEARPSLARTGAATLPRGDAESARLLPLNAEHVGMIR